MEPLRIDAPASVALSPPKPLQPPEPAAAREFPLAETATSPARQPLPETSVEGRPGTEAQGSPEPVPSTPGRTVLAAASPEASATPLDPARAEADLALEGALRFGAGVAPPGGAPASARGPVRELVRDPAAVLRQTGLQPHGGGPGPQAYAHPRAPLRKPGEAQAPGSSPEAPQGLDLLA